jgi:PAS domain S-box-containing protein
MNFPLPPNEEGRLRELAEYQILDTPREEAFDRLVRLATRIFDVPIALITLLDRDRQWFKACYGVDVTETSREVSFCTHAILSDEVMVVPDMTQDPRFADSPLVTGHFNIRFYAGAPLLSRAGYALGTICLLDTKPREFDEQNSFTLVDMAAMVVDELELRKTTNLLQEEVAKRERIAETLVRREAHSRSLIENTQDILTILDYQGRIIFESPSVTRILGYQVGEIEGKRAFDLIHPDDLPEVQKVFADVVSGIGSRLVEFRFKHRDGSWVNLESLGHSLLDEPAVQGIIVNSRDLSERKKMSRELEESEERFKSAFSLSATGMAIVSLDGHWLRVNRALCETLGYTESELLGLTFQELTHPEDLDSDLDKVQQTLAGEIDSYEMEKRYFHRNGNIIWALLSVALVRSLDGEPHYFISQIQNITERKKAEGNLRDSETRKAAILETALDCIITIDHESCILEFNPAAEKTFGYKRADILGKDLTQLIIPPPFRDAHRAGIRKFLATGEGPVLGNRLELPAFRADGAEIMVELAVNHIPMDGPPTFTAYLRDITQRKNDEAALQQAKEEAEAARESAEQANLAKSEFISRMSHELRTPLNAVLGFGQLLEYSTLPPADQQSVAQILRGGRHLLDLINEILDISRIESGHLTFSQEPVSLCEICIESVELAAPLAAQRDIHIDDALIRACSFFVMSDRQRLKQVLLNLLSNAVKYNRPGGTISLSAESGSGRQISLKVTDTGVGIAPEKMNRLFQPFDRLGAEATEVEGAGIGLALTKRLVEAMNGTIKVESVLGQGSTFSVNLPAAESSDEQLERLGISPSGQVPQIKGTQHVMLYIEDNLSNLHLVQRILAVRPEIKLLTALQGNLGLELARQHCPDLILLDLHLPEMPGQKVLQKLKEHTATRDIPVIILSADATRRQQQALLEDGAKAYLTKPLVLNEFLETIDLHLSQVKK